MLRYVRLSAMCVCTLIVYFIVWLCRHIVFCLPVTFSPFSFLDIRETKMLPHVRFETHWSIYKTLPVGSPSLLAASHSFARLLCERSKVRESKSA